VEYTHLAGALGFRGAVDALRGADLVCIDEFELDDPGDTVLMARLLRELADAGARLAATSNTLPGRWARSASPPRTSCARSRRSAGCSRW
jgi:cell division protein ZapE